MRTKFWIESMESRDPSEDLGEDGTKILICILGKWYWSAYIELFWLSVNIVGGFLQEHDIEPSSSI